jgi:hypothetical protein
MPNTAHQALFHMNDHGDIWQEPTLFDQGTESTGALLETTTAGDMFYESNGE